MYSVTFIFLRDGSCSSAVSLLPSIDDALLLFEQHFPGAILLSLYACRSDAYEDL